MITEAPTLRARVQRLVLDCPEQMVLDTAVRVLTEHGNLPLMSTMPMANAAYLAAAVVLLMTKAEAPKVHTVVATDGVSTSDG